jgi:NAD(P) transhydrogenase
MVRIVLVLLIAASVVALKLAHFPGRSPQLSLLKLDAKVKGSDLPNLGQSAFPEPAELYDLIVVGAGPGGEAAAVRAAQLGARVALVERKSSFGGPSGLTSKAVRESAKRIVKAVDQILVENAVSRTKVAGKRKKIAGLWKRKFGAMKSEAEVMQVAETRDRLERNGIDLFIGNCNFVDGAGEFGLNYYDNEGEASSANSEGSNLTLRVCRPGVCVDLVAKHACVATGSRPNRPREMDQRWARLPENRSVSIPFRRGVVMDATEIGSLPRLPAQAAAVIGGGVIAVEYATVLAELGVGVSLICPPQNFMPFLDQELRAKLKRAMKKNHVLFVEEAVSAINLEESGRGDDEAGTVRAKVSLEARILGKGEAKRKLPERKLSVDLILYSGGRNANSEGLGLDAVGVELGKYGRVQVDEDFSTTAKQNVGYSIFAIGDVIGGGLASTATQQARSLAEQIFGARSTEKQQSPSGGAATAWGEKEADVDIEGGGDDFFLPVTAPLAKQCDETSEEMTLFGDLKGRSATDAPLTLWTIPEIASVGFTMEQALSKATTQACKDSIVTGYAYFKDMARGRLSGEREGFLKIVAWKETPGQGHTLAGVHILGEGANELIQTGSILIHANVTLQQISMTPFAAVTLSGLYQMACDDALMKLKAK